MRDRLARLDRQKGRGQRDIADLPAGRLQAGEFLPVEVAARRRFRNGPPPDLPRARRIREGKANDEAQPAQERVVDMILQIRGQHRDAAIRVEPLQQIAHLQIGVAVAAVAHLAAPAEQRVALVEQEHRAGFLGGVENALEILLGLADIFADHRGEIDAKQIALQLAGNDFCCHRLADAARPGEQRRHAEAAVALRRQSPSDRTPARGRARGRRCRAAIQAAPRGRTRSSQPAFGITRSGELRKARSAASRRRRREAAAAAARARRGPALPRARLRSRAPPSRGVARARRPELFAFGRRDRHQRRSARALRRASRSGAGTSI